MSYAAAAGIILTAGAFYNKRRAAHPYAYKDAKSSVAFLIGAFLAICGCTFLYSIHSPSMLAISTTYMVAAIVVALDAVMVDIEYMEIPDSNNVVLAILGIAFSVSCQRSLLETIVPVVIIFGFFLCISLLKESMGGGDVKMAGAMAFFLPMGTILHFLLVAFGAGTIIGGLNILLKKEAGTTHIAFGPYIALAFIVIVVKTYLL